MYRRNANYVASSPAAREDRPERGADMPVMGWNDRRLRVCHAVSANTVFCILSSWVISICVRLSNTCATTCGLLGAVVLVGFYRTVVIMRVGGEINARLAFQAAEYITVSGNKPMGERGAFVANSVARRAQAIDCDGQDERAPR
ncbi:hypothetical protein SALB1_1134 [Salinisphaera sp. LB1]|nr:hypothetical protein SALB1_1134 [Salinisphaera sp. LB1]